MMSKKVHFFRFISLCCAISSPAMLQPAQAATYDHSIVASDNAWVSNSHPFSEDATDKDLDESSILHFRQNPRHTNYLRFDVRELDGATNIVSAYLDLHVQDSGATVIVVALNDGYQSATRRSETAWTSVLTANQAPAYAAWPNDDSSGILASESLTAVGTITSFDLTGSLPSLLAGDSNGEITLILTDPNTGDANVHSVTGAGDPPTLRVRAEYPSGLRTIDVTPASLISSETTDYSAGFTYTAADATSVTFDFSAFGTGVGNGMDLSGCSPSVSAYSFSGFTGNPTGVTVNDTDKTITFTGGTLSDGAHTIDNAVAGAGWRMVNPTTPATQPVTVTTASSTKTVDLPILSALAIDRLNPVSGAIYVYPRTNLVATFNRAIHLVNGGTITVTNLTTGASTVLTVPNAQLSDLNGTNVTISLYKPFSVTGCTYAVQISSDAVEDLYGQYYAGISDASTWRFKGRRNGHSIVASDNARVASDTPDNDVNESQYPYLKLRGNPRNTIYLRFDVSELAGAQEVFYASMDLEVSRNTGQDVNVYALKDGYIDSIRRGETEWTSVLTANLAPAYATWPNANSSGLLTSRAPTPVGTITSFDLKSSLLNLLTNDTNGEITLILVDGSSKGDAENYFYSIESSAEPPTLNVLIDPPPPRATLLIVR